jgi:hypothetical protein
VRADPWPRAIAALTARFARGGDPREAHRASRAILADLAATPGAVEAIFRRHLARPGALQVPHYPVVSFDVERNAHLHLLANAWMARPDGRTDLTTKCLHLHDHLFLTTVTLFGPGYEHWVFDRPVHRGDNRFAARLRDVTPHVVGEPAFVDTAAAHTLMFPSALSITLCLWTRARRAPTTRARARLRRALDRVPDRVRVGALRALAAAPVMDFFPRDGTLLGLSPRHAYPLGPLGDHCRSIVHLLQATGCEDLVPALRAHLDGLPPSDRAGGEAALATLGAGAVVPPCFSAGHLEDPVAIVSRDELRRAVA